MMVGPDRRRRGLGTVEHQVGSADEEQLVLVARRLSSMALTTMVPPPAALGAANLMAAGNPAPPRPLETGRLELGHSARQAGPQSVARTGPTSPRNPQVGP